MESFTGDSRNPRLRAGLGRAGHVIRTHGVLMAPEWPCASYASTTFGLVLASLPSTQDVVLQLCEGIVTSMVGEEL